MQAHPPFGTSAQKTGVITKEQHQPSCNTVTATVVQPFVPLPDQLTAAINAEAFADEEHDVLTATPFSLNDTPVDATESPTQVKVRTPGSHANSVQELTPPSFKNTSERINWYRHHGNKKTCFLM